MPIIDPDGYFGGDRFDKVSDSARMVWPSFFLASNTVARIELNYYKVIAKAFYKWKKKPTEAQFWAWVQEFRDAYLLFVYETEDGQPWGQWDTSEKFLVNYKLKADLESPAPTVADFISWKNEYIALKKAKSNSPNNFGNVLKISKTFSRKPYGGGVGVGGGVGEELEKADASQAPPDTSLSEPPKNSARLIPIAAKTSRFTLRPLDQAWVDWAINKRGWDAARVGEVYESFTDFWISKGGPSALKADWFATWRTWCRNEKGTAKARDSPTSEPMAHMSPREKARYEELMRD